MSDWERARAAHLMLLLILTVMCLVLTVESVLLGWNMEAVVLLLMGVIASWVIYVTERLTAQSRLWLYIIMSLLAFFFYGVHETSIYDLAPVMIMYMAACITTEKISVIRFCLVTYLVTMGYDLLFVVGDSFRADTLTVSRTILHFLLVCMTAYLIRVYLRWRERELGKMHETIRQHEQINERTENFLANVSHELRTPINAVTGITSVMLKKHTDTETRQQLSAIQQAGNRLFGQIEDILDYMEIDTGRICVSAEPYMITSVVNDLIMGSQYLNREHVPELVLDVDPKVPALLEGDSRKIKKILRHLVTNAMKFTQKGGIYVRIYTREKDYGVNLCIQVSDTGEGIAPEHMAQITEHFYQSSEGRNRKAGGLGLVLSIVYGMVAVMDGFVQMKSEPGHGTTVFVSIPQKVADASPAMVIRDREELCLACYLSPEKFELPEVRGYYDELINHMVRGLDVQLHRVFDKNELQRLVAIYQLTHLIIGREEYEADPGYFERLDRNIRVIVIAGGDFALQPGSRAILLKKPFYGLPLVGILNTHSSDSEQRCDDKRMICPHTKVLVVDDEPMNLMVAQGILGDYQMEVTTAASGAQALEICEKEDFDLLFLDHMMPEMDGVETLRRIRKLHASSGRDVTAVAFTANAVSGAREMFAREGFDEFVSKPIETLELERVLRKLVPANRIKYVARVQEEAAVTEPTPADMPDTAHPVSDTTGQITAPRDWVDALEMKGFHTAQALQYSMSDREFYRRVLERFCSEYTSKAKQLQEAYNAQNTADYRIYVHALKSTAKMIGADELSELARSEEKAAEDNNLSYLQQHHAACMARYTDTVQIIAGLLDLGDGATETLTQAQQEKNAITAGQLQETLAQLQSCLDTFEADRAEHLLDEISDASYEGRAVAEMMADIRHDIENFDMDAAAEKLQRIRTQLEGGES